MWAVDNGQIAEEVVIQPKILRDVRDMDIKPMLI
jgi:hypothetical protein